MFLDIIFTSGGTESNNMVLHSALQMFWQQQNTHAQGHTYLRRNSCSHCYDDNETEDSISMRPHFITTNIEHDSITKVLRHFQTEGLAGLDDMLKRTLSLLETCKLYLAVYRYCNIGCTLSHLCLFIYDVFLGCLHYGRMYRADIL